MVVNIEVVGTQEEISEWSKAQDEWRRAIICELLAGRTWQTMSVNLKATVSAGASDEGAAARCSR